MGKAKDHKGNKGRSQRIQCDACGRYVGKEKAIKTEKFGMPVDEALFRELESQGTKIHISSCIVWYCISCSRHRKMKQTIAKRKDKANPFNRNRNIHRNI